MLCVCSAYTDAPVSTARCPLRDWMAEVSNRKNDRDLNVSPHRAPQSQKPTWAG